MLPHSSVPNQNFKAQGHYRASDHVCLCALAVVQQLGAVLDCNACACCNWPGQPSACQQQVVTTCRLRCFPYIIPHTSTWYRTHMLPYPRHTELYTYTLAHTHSRLSGQSGVWVSAPLGPDWSQPVSLDCSSISVVWWEAELTGRQSCVPSCTLCVLSMGFVRRACVWRPHAPSVLCWWHVPLLLSSVCCSVCACLEHAPAGLHNNAMQGGTPYVLRCLQVLHVLLVVSAWNACGWSGAAWGLGKLCVPSTAQQAGLMRTLVCHCGRRVIRGIKEPAVRDEDEDECQQRLPVAWMR